MRPGYPVSRAAGINRSFTAEVAAAAARIRSAEGRRESGPRIKQANETLIRRRVDCERANGALGITRIEHTRACARTAWNARMPVWWLKMSLRQWQCHPGKSDSRIIVYNYVRVMYE